MKIIGVSGKAGSGKDTVGQIIANELNYKFPYVKRNFADPLKESCIVKYGLTREQVYDPELKGKMDSYWGVTPRQILQFEGTEATRNIINGLIPGILSGFWIARMQLELDKDKYIACEYAIICDVRFQNEADWVLANGCIINVIRPSVEPVGFKGHASEEGFTVLSGERNYYEILNDGTIEELETKVIELIKEFK